MYQINEFNNSQVGQALAAEKQEAKDRKITVTVTLIALAFLIITFKHAIGH